MVSHLENTTNQQEIFYPDSDGQPIANNTIQYRWLVTIQQNIDKIYADNPNVFVAGDLFWYPIEGINTVVNAPDIMVVFGRPKGDRLSYKQWQENNIPPQVFLEILSPSNTSVEMAKKLLFYERYGVEEYYIYDPQTNQLQGWIRGEYGLDAIESLHNWVSPRLKIRFELSPDTLWLYRPDGTKFVSYQEISQQLEQTQQQLEQERQRTEQMEELLKQYKERFGDIPASDANT
ncbi:protein of unknown function DUF820 [Gloeothece citriformis PCC 7424]|uniref:Putative restriction endonuclease domain-containing protein n=1 Tax=Gloeothece citriformis (strain PCC 7424) TaxID=65393 RepID=B7KBW4_GLOC7|nr:Uma2 family endonuclease [Gloeothece citriformis]ACK68787.1 protein of unknown function DUF820 [Gloeothece citriformis PCC 7424]